MFGVENFSDDLKYMRKQKESIISSWKQMKTANNRRNPIPTPK